MQSSLEPKPQQEAIRDYLLIKQMLIPPGWIEEKEERGPFDLRSRRMFHAPNAERVGVCSYARGKPVNQSAANSFKDVLSKPVHELTASEVSSIALILREASLPGEFDLSSIKTELWNGKIVLVVEGRWVEAQWDTYWLIADIQGTGEFIQEIYYIAPAADYSRFCDVALQSLASLEWVR
jgi:hypothetical protein